jgi:6-pyruvoyltetrahydropterin/6-carboxytetrahydropterin synthase
MPEAALIRTVRFTASHRYWREEWTEDQNRKAFGAQTAPHEHEFSLQVEIVGEIDPRTGFVVDLVGLDQILEELAEPLRDRLLNDTLAECGAGELPSTENLARWFHLRIAARLPHGQVLRAVSVAESDELRAEYRP